MRGLRQIPRRLLPNDMLVWVGAVDGERGEARLVRHVRFERMQKESGDAHRSADDGGGTVFIDAVNSQGAFEVPVGARVLIGRTVDARGGVQALLRVPGRGAPLGADGAMRAVVDAVTGTLRAAGFTKVFTCPPSALDCAEPVVVRFAGFERESRQDGEERGAARVEFLVVRERDADAMDAAFNAEAGVRASGRAAWNAEGSGGAHRRDRRRGACFQDAGLQRAECLVVRGPSDGARSI